MSTSSLDRSADALLQQKASQFSQYERLDVELQKLTRSTRSSSQLVKQTAVDAKRVEEDLNEIVEGNSRLEATIQQQALRAAVLIAAVKQTTTAQSTLVTELQVDRQWSGLVPRLLRVMQGLRERSACLDAFSEALPPAGKLLELLTRLAAVHRLHQVEGSARKLHDTAIAAGTAAQSQLEEQQNVVTQTKQETAADEDSLAQLRAALDELKTCLEQTEQESTAAVDHLQKLNAAFVAGEQQDASLQAEAANLLVAIGTAEYHRSVSNIALQLCELDFDARRSTIQTEHIIGAEAVAAYAEESSQLEATNQQSEQMLSSLQQQVSERSDDIAAFCEGHHALMRLVDELAAEDAKNDELLQEQESKLLSAQEAFADLHRLATQHRADRHVVEQEQLTAVATAGIDSILAEFDNELINMSNAEAEEVLHIRRAELEVAAAAAEAERMAEAQRAEQLRAAERQRAVESERHDEARRLRERNNNASNRLSEYLDEQAQLSRTTVVHRPLNSRHASAMPPPPPTNPRGDSVSSEWSILDSHQPKGLVNGGRNVAVEPPSPLPRPPVRLLRPMIVNTGQPRSSQLTGLAAAAKGGNTQRNQQQPIRVQPKLVRPAVSKAETSSKKKPVVQLSESDDFDVFAI